MSHSTCAHEIQGQRATRFTCPCTATFARHGTRHSPSACPRRGLLLCCCQQVLQLRCSLPRRGRRRRQWLQVRRPRLQRQAALLQLLQHAVLIAHLQRGRRGRRGRVSTAQLSVCLALMAMGWVLGLQQTASVIVAHF